MADAAQAGEKPDGELFELKLKFVAIAHEADILESQLNRAMASGSVLDLPFLHWLCYPSDVGFTLVLRPNQLCSPSS